MHKRDNKFEVKWLIKPLFLVMIMWIVFWIEMRFHTDFTKYGILPRSLQGSLGILTSPFIHSGFSHLWSNTVPIAVLTFFLGIFYYKESTRILIFGVLLSGVLTWMIGRTSYHIGASGLIYVLASFIFFKGVFINNYRHIAASLIIVFLYGSLIWYVLPVKSHISWEGHLSGAITGLILACCIKVTIPKAYETVVHHNPISKEEEWFLQQFDEQGNFSPISLDTDEEE